MRRCGNDQQGCDMADLKMDSSRRAKMIQLNHLEPQARIQCPCVLVNSLYVRHARCGCVFCVHNLVAQSPRRVERLTEKRQFGQGHRRRLGDFFQPSLFWLTCTEVANEDAHTNKVTWPALMNRAQTHPTVPEGRIWFKVDSGDHQ